MARNLDRLLRDYIAPPAGMRPVDFAAPTGAPALFAPDSVSWRIMKNPIALSVGGIAAVILELAEPRVRTGVWEHTTFRRDPVTRMRRTGYAAWVTVYGPEETARAMISGVVRAHERVEGRTPSGVPYRANEPELLTWVHATAAFGFVEAYTRFVRPLAIEDVDRFYAEGASVAADLDALFAAIAPKLERSAIVLEFFDIVRAAQLLPWRRLQRLMIRAAVEITPSWAREILGLGPEYGFKPSYESLVRAMGAASERFVLEDAPPAQACKRLGLPRNYLYR
jgi:uncharacterized protein (DUF2236 family)